MNCLYCGQAVQGRKSRKFCNDAHKQAYWRKQRRSSEAMTVTELRQELEETRQQVVELEQEVTRLRGKLDVERWFRGDHQQRSFKAWLKKQPAAHIGEVGRRILSDDFLPVMGSRALYEAHLRKNKYSRDELAEFANLWKLMLLS